MQGTNVSNPCTTLQMSAVTFNSYLSMQSRRDPSGKTKIKIENLTAMAKISARAEES